MSRAIETLLRFAYCAMVPMIIGGVSIVVPVVPIIAGAALGTAIAIGGGDRWRAIAARVPLIGRGLGNLARLGDFYREQPPRHVLYYIAYPLLLPYWLISRRARAEFLLYRKLNALAFAVLIGFGAIDYFTRWRPELGLAMFLRAALATFLLQSVLTMMAIMPLSTTVIAFHQRGRRRLLVALAIALAVTSAGAIGFVVKSTQLPYPTEFRLRKRAEVEPARADQALAHAAAAARAAIAPDAVEGEQPGAPLDAARAALEDLWKPDEARGFRVWWSGAPFRVVIVWAWFPKHAPIWYATDPNGRVGALEALPRRAQAELQRSKP